MCLNQNGYYEQYQRLHPTATGNDLDKERTFTATIRRNEYK